VPDTGAFLAEMFGFQLFERDGRLQALIRETLNRYEDRDARIPADDLAAAAGGLTDVPPDSEGGESK